MLATKQSGAESNRSNCDLRCNLCRFAHKGLEALFLSGSKAGVLPAHASRLRRQLAQLDAATGSQDMGLPGWGLRPLKGELAGHWSIWVSGNWRMTFRFDGRDAVLVDYRDFH
jgi:proteic killer suppression protein